MKFIAIFAATIVSTIAYAMPTETTTKVTAEAIACANGQCTVTTKECESGSECETETHQVSIEQVQQNMTEIFQAVAGQPNMTGVFNLTLPQIQLPHELDD